MISFMMSTMKHSILQVTEIMITKSQAVSQFRYNWKVAIKQNSVVNNISAKREAWGIFTDDLCKEGYISMKKYESWTSPF